MSTGPAAIIDPWVLQHSSIVESSGWDSDFPAANILDPNPKVKAKIAAATEAAHFVLDTTSLGGALPLDVFSVLFMEGVKAEGPSTHGSQIRIRTGASNGAWVNDTGFKPMWPVGFEPASVNPLFEYRLPDPYVPPGVAMHIFLSAPWSGSGTNFARFDFAEVASGAFRIGAAACAKVLILPAEFGSSAGTPVEDSEDIFTWGDERLVRPGPKYDAKDWSFLLAKQTKEETAYVMLKRRGKSAPLIAVDELPAPFPAENEEPWTRHQGTLYGTIADISPLVWAAPGLFRSNISFKEL